MQVVTKAKLINYLKIFWKKGLDEIFIRSCLNCHIKLNPEETHFCLSCFVIHLCFDHVNADHIVFDKKFWSQLAPLSWTKQTCFIEAIWLKYLLDQIEPFDLVVIDAFFYPKKIDMLFPFKPFDPVANYTNKRVVFLALFNHKHETIRYFFELGKVTSLRTCFIFS